MLKEVPITNTHQEQATLLSSMHMLNKQISAKFEKCTGIGQSRLGILHYLYQVEEMSQTTLQKEVNIDHAAITRHLKQLEASGMVARRKSAEDNRVTLVCLTEEGRSKILHYQNEKDHFIQQMLSGFSKDELNLLADMVERMNQNISRF
ncbi:transcriptional regulator [Paenibacillus selenitireducens]|uniref:Transcriptional regulator n=1 Tax=Paenibacillus selenitireducens TaxID=1324314 RepID=A0A1T2XM67_9BACL|nr:MarR family transcriptional regulator [Paenibacillus selenitireducens]OPA80836.1 transcriptional regulator [Paenibacillus selenitireducens]